MVAKKLYQVECTSTYKMIYVCEAECAEYAMDQVTCNDADSTNHKDEIHQEHLGETIFSVREISHSDFVELCETACNGRYGEQLVLKYE